MHAFLTGYLTSFSVLIILCQDISLTLRGLLDIRRLLLSLMGFSGKMDGIAVVAVGYVGKVMEAVPSVV